MLVATVDGSTLTALGALADMVAHPTLARDADPLMLASNLKETQHEVGVLASSDNDPLALNRFLNMGWDTGAEVHLGDDQSIVVHDIGVARPATEPLNLSWDVHPVIERFDRTVLAADAQQQPLIVCDLSERTRNDLAVLLRPFEMSAPLRQQPAFDLVVLDEMFESTVMHDRVSL